MMTAEAKTLGKFALGDDMWPDSPMVDGEEFDTEEEAIAYIANMRESDRDFYADNFVLVQSEAWYPSTSYGDTILEHMHEEYAGAVHDGRDNFFLDDSLTRDEVKELEEALDAAIGTMIRERVRPAILWRKVREIKPEELPD